MRPISPASCSSGPWRWRRPHLCGDSDDDAGDNVDNVDDGDGGDDDDDDDDDEGPFTSLCGRVTVMMLERTFTYLYVGE
jgi:hypothetical protein